MARTTTYSPQFSRVAVQLVTQYQRSVRSVALELGIGQSTLRQVGQKMNSENTPTSSNESPPTAQEILAMREENESSKAANKTLKVKLVFSKKLPPGWRNRRMKCQAIQHFLNHDPYPLDLMLRVLKGPRSTWSSYWTVLRFAST